MLKLLVPRIACVTQTRPPSSASRLAHNVRLAQEPTAPFRCDDETIEKLLVKVQDALVPRRPLTAFLCSISREAASIAIPYILFPDGRPPSGLPMVWTSATR
jgi:hypothetical protein